LQKQLAGKDNTIRGLEFLNEELRQKLERTGLDIF